MGGTSSLGCSDRKVTLKACRPTDHGGSEPVLPHLTQGTGSSPPMGPAPLGHPERSPQGGFYFPDCVSPSRIVHRAWTIHTFHRVTNPPVIITCVISTFIIITGRHTESGEGQVISRSSGCTEVAAQLSRGPPCPTPVSAQATMPSQSGTPAPELTSSSGGPRTACLPRLPTEEGWRASAELCGPWALFRGCVEKQEGRHPRFASFLPHRGCETPGQPRCLREPTGSAVTWGTRPASWACAQGHSER